MVKDVSRERRESLPRPSGQPEYCDFCSHETIALKWYEGARSGEGVWLCMICAATPAGNVALHPTVHQSADVDVLRTVVTTTWMILKAIERKAT